jgi:hypothetical protein
MKQLTTPAILVGGLILVVQSAWAQSVVPNDLYLGFQNTAGDANADYIINLGAKSNIVGGSSVVVLSSDFSSSKFNSVLNGSASVMGGVVGGNQNGSASNPYDCYATQLRAGGAGNPATPGSDLSGVTLSSANDSSAFSDLGTLDAPTAGTGVLDTGKSWQSTVENGTEISGTFWSATGVNPDSAVSGSGVLYEDLWQSSSTGGFSSHPFQYLGYFALDLSGGSPKLTFTPKNAPASLTPPVITSVKKTGGTVTLVWNTMTNHTYQLQYTASLSPTNWIDIGGAVPASGGSMTNTDSGATDSQRFYRVKAQ